MNRFISSLCSGNFFFLAVLSSFKISLTGGVENLLFLVAVRRATLPSFPLFESLIILEI